MEKPNEICSHTFVVDYCSELFLHLYLFLSVSIMNDVFWGSGSD